jgi:hypothetical protein
MLLRWIKSATVVGLSHARVQPGCVFKQALRAASTRGQQPQGFFGCYLWGGPGWTSAATLAHLSQRFLSVLVDIVVVHLT